MSGKILVVEDNHISQRVLSWQLEQLGRSCDIVSTGATALKALEIRHYRLIFMDMHLPDMDGCETTELIRRAGFTMPIIAITAEDAGENFQKCLDAGMNGYLSKPVEATVLENALNLWMPADTQQNRTGGARLSE
jgi:CheY-like chemotaxis protein